MAVQTYVGARYVPKFSDKNNGDWDNQYSYEPLEIVKNGNDFYTAKIPVPVGAALNDTTYWALTGNYNGAISTLDNRVIALEDEVKYILPVYNIAEYGMNPGDNIYDDLFDLLRDVVYPNGGGIVFVPAGKYYLDYTIILPDNVIILGEGDKSQIIFDLTDLYIGGAISIGGSHIMIKDIAIDIATNAPYNIRGSIPGAIGISDFDYVLMDTKRSHTLYRKSGNHDITLINVNCPESNYGIGIEPLTYLVKDIFIVNHACPTGMFSVQPNSNTVQIENVYCENIVCDCFRAGVGYHGVLNYNIDGLYTKQIAIGTSNIRINNFTLDGGRGNRRSGADFEAEAMLIAGDNIQLSNGIIREEAGSPQTRLLRAPSSATRWTVQLDNIFVEDVTVFTTSNTLPSTDLYMSNCNFDGYPVSYRSLKNYSRLSANVPEYIYYDCDHNKSKIKALSVYDGSDGYVVASLPDWLSNSAIVRDGYGWGWAYNAGDPSVPMMPVQIKLDGSTKEIIVNKKTVSSTWNSYTYNAVYIDLEW